MSSKADDTGCVFHGTIVHSTGSNSLEILENAVLGVKNGKVLFLEKESRLQEQLHEHELDRECDIGLTQRQFLMPGLVDCHIHAPQLPLQALGTDLSLLDWLDTYTFPIETKFADLDFARHSHEKTVLRTLRGGTTAASYYSTIHADTTLLLCQIADRLGQRALVGKVNMDMSSPDYYRETTEQSVAETERFINEVLSLKSSLVTPVITPRFAVSCSQDLLKQLALLARVNQLPVQTHISETLQEVDTVLKLHRGHESYCDVYDAAGLLSPKTILAHCVHLSDKELGLLKSRGCGLVHCACSNTTLRSGILDIRRLLDHGLKIGLGTDMAGGYTTSMLAAMRHAVDVSNICTIQHQQKQHDTRLTNHHVGNGLKPYHPLTMAEAFRLATLGGSAVLSQNCGNFEPGKEFDALVIDPEVKDSPLDLYSFDTSKNAILKFLYAGDDRNIVTVYVQGRKLVNKTD